MCRNTPNVLQTEKKKKKRFKTHLIKRGWSETAEFTRVEKTCCGVKKYKPRIYKIQHTINKQ